MGGWVWVGGGGGGEPKIPREDQQLFSCPIAAGGQCSPWGSLANEDTPREG